MGKIKIAVIFGGTSTEHEVSIASAKSVIEHLDPTKFEVVPIYITKQNQWTELPIPQAALLPETIDRQIIPTDFKKDNIDVIFPVMHGQFGEDGSIQGMLEMLHIPYVGCGILASALCMDKVIQKQLCMGLGIPIAPFVSATKYEWGHNPEEFKQQIQSKLTYPLFIKPVNQGSSVGITKVHSSDELDNAINQAFIYDTKAIAEQGINNARELECAVLGNDDPKTSVVGEIIASNEFYDYDAKYIDGKSQAIIPAKITREMTKKIQSLALNAYKILGCSGLARADFLMDGSTHEIFLNELNTIPGFTEISMYPKLWQASGVTYEKLLETLIECALEKNEYQSTRTTQFTPKSNWIAPDHE